MAHCATFGGSKISNIHNSSRGTYINSLSNSGFAFNDDYSVNVITASSNSKVTIKYGMKPRNRFDKAGIDNEFKNSFGNLDKNCFRLINTDDHSKILICDEDFMIMGSFNWLSFGGGNEKDARGETSSINMNKAEIIKQIEKFK